jgi:hypothetical protein
MQEFSHVRILAAYLMRLPPIVYKKLNEANRAAWQETLNGNSRSQLAAQESELEVIRAAVECMTETDKQVIARIVREELAA